MSREMNLGLPIRYCPWHAVSATPRLCVLAFPPRRSLRRGISLLEVLISMFVLAVGLLGVAALIPAGHHEIAQGSRLEYASMIGRSAFRDLKVRGMLTPGNWDGTYYWRLQNGNPAWAPTGPDDPQPFVVNGAKSAHVAFALDPLGIANGFSGRFPHNPGMLRPFLTRIAPMDMTTDPATAAALMDTVFRSSVDLITAENTTNRDLPPEQLIFTENAGVVSTLRPSLFGGGDTFLRRASEGNYSWLATIVSDHSHTALSGTVTVSVAVFHKRDLSTAGAGEIAATASVIGSPGTTGSIGLGGGDVTINGITPASKVIRPGEWIMLAGRRLISSTQRYDYFRWYRVVSAGKKSGFSQRVSLAGTDWDPELFNTAFGTSAFVFDNIVAVYEKNVTLKVE
jgi:hypothetical protein